MNIFLALALTGFVAFAYPWSICAQNKPSAKPVSNNTVQALPLSPQEQAVRNLQAFTKLYGYVRYFHPSDEATKIDWNKFAIYGTGKVKNARTTSELASTLEELFLPIAPTLQILRPNEKSRVSAVPGNPIQHQVVAWQHRGIGLGVMRYGRTYESIRLNRDNDISSDSPSFGTITQGIRNSTTGTHISELQGKQIKMVGRMKAQVSGAGNQGQFWLRVDKKSGTGFFDNMQDRPVTTTEWGEYSIIGTVDTVATAVAFGAFLLGKGKVWADDIRLFTRNAATEEWKPVAIENPSFETFTPATSGSFSFAGWNSSPTYKFTASADNAPHGKVSVCIENKSEEAKRFRGELFAEKPKGGEMLLKDLAGGLQCALPIALYGDSTTTLGATTQSATAFTTLLNTVNAIKLDSTALEQEPVRLANVVMAWNVLQHSYPYFDVTGISWNDALTTTLAGTLKSVSKQEFTKTMQQMLEKLRDGHANYYEFTPSLLLPIELVLAEGKPVVIASKDTLLKQGDVLLQIDGKDVQPMITQLSALASGTTQWKQSRALRALTASPKLDVSVTVNRKGETVIVNTMRQRPGAVYEHTPIKQIVNATNNAKSVWYVDLSQATIGDFQRSVKEIADAKGIIFDLRGYPNGNHEILSYLTDTAITSARWNIPRMLYPDGERVQGYDTNGRWPITPMQPRIKGKVVFLTGGGAISYAESVMGIVEYYKLGDIVGETTAGANGNVNSMNLLGNARISWTGMKVLKHDGSQHHLVGIKPTVPAVRTVQGIRAGRDEVLEKALSLMP